MDADEAYDLVRAYLYGKEDLRAYEALDELFTLARAGEGKPLLRGWVQRGPVRPGDPMPPREYL